MENKQLKDIEFTHLVSVYGMKCLLNEETSELTALSWINCLLLTAILKFKFYILKDSTVPIEIIARREDLEIEEE